MELTSSFKEFLENVVNLNKTRVEVAERGITTITSYIQNTELFSGIFIDSSPQGSFRQETIIKPIDSNHDFDVDLLVEFKSVGGWEPKDYLTKLADEFRKSDRYKDKVDTRGKNRCVTIDYESDFHIDVVPTIAQNNGYVIMNKKTNQFEPTDGNGYAQWFANRNTITTAKNLTKVTRLVKYIRDYQQSFEAKSILLTTLLGKQVYDSDTAQQYSNISTALITIFGRLDEYLQDNPTMPLVQNPVLPEENFNRHWDQNKYTKFRRTIHVYTGLIKDAYAEADEQKSIEKWQQVFGDKFGSRDKAHRLTKTITRDAGEQFLSDLGIKEEVKYQIRINAQVVQDGWRPFLLRGWTDILRKKHKLEFYIESSTVPEPYELKWKVKNIGVEAKSAGDLRGEITDDLGVRKKVERTRYEGSHYVECYAIKHGICVAKDKLDVPIGKI